MQTEYITQKAFDSLPEYSCTLPTMQTIGKVWKSKIDYTDESLGWLIGEYVESNKPRMVGIEWRKLSIVD